MRHLVTLLLSCIASTALAYNAGGGVWQKLDGNIGSTGTRVIVPDIYSVYTLKTNYLRNTLASLSTDPANAAVLEFPTPDGAVRSYKIWQTPMMESALAAKYPDIRTFTGYAAEAPGVTIKLDYNKHGIHAMVYDGGNTYFIDPYSNKEDGYYICYYKKNYQRPAGNIMACEVGDETRELMTEPTYLTKSGLPTIKFKTHGTFQRTYRLALACTGEYAVAVDGPTPTKAGVLSKMVTSINRVNGVFERELALTLGLIGNTDTLIFLNSSTDPYNNTGSDMTPNQNTITNRIGSANYDMGHLFGTGAGGFAMLGSVCKNNKAMGVTGQPAPLGDPFDIDFVAHEMGHQFGAEHSFNGNTGSCAGESEQPHAYEPGSGSSIMGYAGICAGENLQAHSDDYFHAKSLDLISTFITSLGGGNCALATPIINVPPVVPAFTQTYNIPYLTPFELTAPTAVDVDHDALTYCWEQWNLGDWKQSWANTQINGPIFRSFLPTTSPTRVFPKIDSLVRNVTSYLGEKLPNNARTLTFRLTVRDMLNGLGTFNFPIDSLRLNVLNTGSPFEVTHPNTSINWTSGNPEAITWNVGGTDGPVINCNSVDIFLSLDGGYTYPIQLAANTPNDGTETITVPSLPMTNTARVKVKGSGNVFFDVSNINFAINDPSNVKEVAWQNAVRIYPVPSSDVLHISNDHNKKLSLNIINAVGQKVYDGEVVKRASIPVSSWAKGVYYVRFSEIASGEGIVRTIVVQ